MSGRESSRSQFGPLEAEIADKDLDLDLEDETVLVGGSAESAFQFQRRSGSGGRTLLDLLLKGEDDALKSRVWELVVQFDLDPDDPLFLMMVATGRLQVLLERSPKELNAMFDQWETQLHSGLQDYRQGLEHYERAAVKAQQKAIANSVRELIRKTAVEQFMKNLNVFTISLGAIVVGVAAVGGGFLGVWWEKARTSTAEFDPSGMRQLTLEQVQAMNWAMSEEGKYAKNLLGWNRDLLSQSGSGRLACEKEVQRLKLTRVVTGGDKAQKGFCVLWVKPVGQRGL